MWCVQAYNGGSSIAKRATMALGRHAAPEECDPLLTKFAWNLDQKGAQMQLWLFTHEEIDNQSVLGAVSVEMQNMDRQACFKHAS